RLPVPLRLAVRDGARNRARTAPAVAAIMAAVAGAGAIATVDAGDSERASAGYRPRLPMGATMIQVPPTPAGEDRAARVRAAIERELPGLPLLDLWALPGGTCHREIDPECRTVSFEHAGPGRPTPPGTVPGDGPAWARKLFGRNEPVEGVNVYPDIVVGGAAEARMLLGRDAPEAVAALRAGKIVLFGGGPTVHGGTVTATVRELDRDVPAPVPVRRVRGLPAVRVPAAVHPTAVMPPSAAERIGLRPRVAAFGVDGAEHRLGEAEAARLGDVLAGTEGGHRGDVYTERGPRRTGDSRAPLLAALAAVLALGGALTATRLSAADARPDLAVLAAVGARARTRRLLAAGQAAYIAALGCWLGIAAGIVPGLAASRLLARGPGDHGDPGPFLDVPWTTLLLIGIGVPLITAVVAGLCTRPKLPMTHATAT
ncbi:FtsX-like permease family protein, partial [Actinomadura sediminis]